MYDELRQLGRLAMIATWAATAVWAGVEKTEREPPVTLFHLDFENAFTADTARGPVEPTNANRPKLTTGISGRAAHFSQAQNAALRYLTDGVLDSDKGAFSLWVRCSPNYLSGAWKFIFSLDSSQPPGGKSLALWMPSWDGVGRGIRYDVRVRPKVNSMLYTPGFSGESLKEWHHFVCAWDGAKGKIAFFLDGYPTGAGSQSKKSFDIKPFVINQEAAFLLGAVQADGKMSWEGDIDEFKVFNRPLSLHEVRDEFCASQSGMAVMTDLMDRYFTAGRAEHCRLEFANWSAKPVIFTPRVEIENPEGGEKQTIALPEIMLPAGQERRVEFPLTLNCAKETGYVLTVSYHTEGGLRTRAFDIRGLPEQEASAGNGERVLVAELDAAEVKPVAESAPSRIVDSPLGRYREAGANFGDRFALEFAVDQPGALHVAEFDIPDDKRRTEEVIYQPLSGAFTYQGQGGIFTGGEYPLSKKLIRHTMTFWPTAPKNCFIFKTNDSDAPAAVRTIRIFRLPHGFRPLPVESFSGSVPARSLGMYYEDPVMASSFGIVQTDNVPEFSTVVDRLLDYMQSFGLNLFRYPVIWYAGPLYGQSKSGNSGASGRKHPRDFPAYLLKRLNARGMKFNGWLHIHQLASLNPYCLIDEERVLAGEETAVNMRGDNHLFYTGWHSKDPAYNPLDPRVQRAVKNLVSEILDRYGQEPALEGFTLNVTQCSLFAFGSIKSGYNDCNLRAFQEDTGIRIPVDAHDPQRFTQSHDWLLANARAEWITWRCRKIHDYYREIADLLTTARPDLKLGVSLYQYPVTHREGLENADYLRAGHDPNQWHREQGLDAALFARDRNIVLIRHGDLRLRDMQSPRRRRSGSQLEALENLRTTSLAPEMVQVFAQLPAAELNLHDGYWEDAVGRKSPLALPDGGRECPWRVAQLNANTFYALEQFVAGVNNFDALSIAKGGFVIGLNGMEPYMGRFAQAFRALPAVKFSDVPGLADPVRVRQRVVDGSNYFYVLNRLPYPVTVEIRLAGAEAEDLVSNEKSAGDKILLTLKPYDLRSFRQAGTESTVIGGTAKAPENLVTELSEQTAAIADEYKHNCVLGVDLSRQEPYLEKARACLAAGEYARLYFLLQEAWVPDIRRLSDQTRQSFLNQTRQSFLKTPRDYLEKNVLRPRTLTAVGVSAAPVIDGELNEPDWQEAPVCSDFSEFMTIQGKFLARPAENSTKIRLLHDEKTLYIGVECADPQPDKITVNPGLRDAAIWSDDDSLEIFLRTPAFGATGHVQLVVNAGGSRTDLFSSDLKYDFDWSAVSKVTSAGWQAEIAVPFAALAEKMSNGNSPQKIDLNSGWQFNLSRRRREFPAAALVADAQYEWKCEAHFANIRMD